METLNKNFNTISSFATVGLVVGSVIAVANVLNRHKSKAYREVQQGKKEDWLLLTRAVAFSALKGTIYGVLSPFSIIYMSLGLVGVGPHFDSHLIPVSLPDPSSN